MFSRWEWIFKLLTRRLWFKAALYGIVAIATALGAIFLAPIIPDNMAELVGPEAVEKILSILASSMLAVATFSLGTMVAAFAAASSAATPRASQLLVEDPLSQNVLSTFIGAFIFSLVGLIALSTGLYGPAGRFVLFGVTIVVVIAVLITFFRWIDYLSNLGRLSETLEKVERAATRAVKARASHPFLCCSPFRSLPVEAHPHYGENIGYVQHLDVESLQTIADTCKGEIWVERIPGHWNDGSVPLFATSWRPDEETLNSLRAAFLINSTRSFDQDPRFGIIVLSEIASRALSPGINDPGTAIDVIGRLSRVLSVWADESASNEPQYKRVFVPEVSARDMFDDAFGPIARDGAGTVEVGIRLQKALSALAQKFPRQFGEPAKALSDLAIAFSDTALKQTVQKQLLHSVKVSPERGTRSSASNLGLQ